ncbi:MAG: MBL fold metallo-hydrolase [Acidobacteriota bacterium]
MERRLVLRGCLVLTTILVCVMALLSGWGFGTPFPCSDEAAEVTIITLYDNYPLTEGLTTDWGFAALIEINGTTILFDTGENGPTLLGNIDKLGLKPQGVDAVVLSHYHGDHTEGLFPFLEKWGAKKLCVPRSFPAAFKEKASTYGELVEVSDSAKIFDRVYTTGEMGTSIIEQALIIETSQGVVLITGCAHPGIVDIVKKAKELTRQEVHLVLGGFHLGGKSDKELEDIISAFRSLGVKKVSATHCTGEQAIEMFRQTYGENFIRNGVGKKIVIAE